MRVRIDGETVETATAATVGALLRSRGPIPPARDWAPVRATVDHPLCPLLERIAVDGRVLPLSAALGRQLRAGMVVETDGPAVRAAIQEGRRALEEEGRCPVAGGFVELAAAEAESAGYLVEGARATWSEPLRSISPAIEHDPNLCIRCGACVEVCRSVQGVAALRRDDRDGVLPEMDRCVHCGQCTLVCPMGLTGKYDASLAWLGCADCAFARPRPAMREVDSTQAVLRALADPNRFVVAQIAPSVRITAAEEWGLPPGALPLGQLVAALRRIGCDRVWDTTFGADLTILEEGAELRARLAGEGGPLPLITSCSPGWVCDCERYFPDLRQHLSTAKSPQQMFGAIAKTHGARALGVDPARITVLSVMPCTAKSVEAARPEMDAACRYWSARDERPGAGAAPTEPYPDVDMVLTVRAFARLCKSLGVRPATLPEEAADDPLGEGTGAATIFGRSGGVMEAALRMVTAQVATESRGSGTDAAKRMASPDAPPASAGEACFHMPPLMEDDAVPGLRTGTASVGGTTLRLAVAHGLAAAHHLCRSIREGGVFADYDYIEIMGCPGGCIGGGGQPMGTDGARRAARAACLNDRDRGATRRESTENPAIQALYADFLGAPLGELSHALLHTRYEDRSAGLAPPRIWTEDGANGEGGAPSRGGTEAEGSA